MKSLLIIMSIVSFGLSSWSLSTSVPESSYTEGYVKILAETKSADDDFHPKCCEVNTSNIPIVTATVTGDIDYTDNPESGK